MKVKVIDPNIHNGAIRWQISKSINRKTFLLELSSFPRLAFHIFEHEYLAQGRGVQYSQQCRSMADVNLYKSHSAHIYAGSYRFRYVNVSSVRPCKFSQGHITTLAVMPFGREYQHL